MRRWARCCCVAVLIALAGAASASAASVGSASGGVVYSAEAQEANDVTIVLDGDVYRITDAGAPLSVLPGPCQATADPSTATCAAAGIESISAALRDGDDQLEIRAPARALITGGSGRDTIRSGDGGDLIFGMEGADEIHAGGGDDIVSELDADGNVIDGGRGADRLSGSEGDDTVLGGDGDDPALFGGEGNDVVDGGAGDDVLYDEGPQLGAGDADRLAGGPGADTVTYELRADGVRTSIADGANDGVLGERDDVAGDVERLMGTQGSDELVGGEGPELLDGRGGSDLLEGGGGADLLDGGSDDGSSDTLQGGAGADTLDGRAGGDLLDGGPDADVLRGGTNADRVLGGAGADVLDGGEGDDTLDGGADADAISGGPGVDTVRYVGRSVEVSLDGIANDGGVTPTADGRTRLEEGATSEGDDVDLSNERVTGSGDDDTVAGDATPNDLAGAAGEDYLEGGRGADNLSGGARADTIVARDGATDRISCGPGYDYVIADERDLLPRAGRPCEYVDDGSRTGPRPRRDVAVTPRCADRRDDADVSPPRTTRTVPLDGRSLVPVGSRVDSFDCAVNLRVAVGGGRTRTGTLSRRTGALRVTQRRRPDGRLMTRLTATDCAATGSASPPQAVASRFRLARYRRRLGRIGFPAEVRISTGILRPRGLASFEVDDRCGRGATVTVTSGVVDVVDIAGDRTVVLRAGGRDTGRTSPRR